jgi:fructose-1,6-bisphosphatase/inositol monophosphatase family enzyme
MVAYLRAGHAVASWILHPPSGTVHVAERGGGAWRDGRRVERRPAPQDPAGLRGAVLTRFLAPAVRGHVDRQAPLFGHLDEGTGCAGVTYAQLTDGATDFAVFHRTLPWDHAPGALLLVESGGRVARLDGSPYAPGQTTTGLVAASDAHTWHTVRHTLLP